MIGLWSDGGSNRCFTSGLLLSHGASLASRPDQWSVARSGWQTFSLAPGPSSLLKFTPSKRENAALGQRVHACMSGVAAYAATTIRTTCPRQSSAFPPRLYESVDIFEPGQASIDSLSRTVMELFNAKNCSTPLCPVCQDVDFPTLLLPRGLRRPSSLSFECKCGAECTEQRQLNQHIGFWKNTDQSDQHVAVV